MAKAAKRTARRTGVSGGSGAAGRAGGRKTSSAPARSSTRSAGGVAELVAMRTAKRTASRSGGTKTISSSKGNSGANSGATASRRGSGTASSRNATETPGGTGHGARTGGRRKTTKRNDAGIPAKGTTVKKAVPRGKGGAKKSAGTAVKSKKPVRRTRVVEVQAGADRPGDDGHVAQRIAERAYEIWQARGGDERSNWLEAEREILGEGAE